MAIIKKVHHIAIICADYQKSKVFYTEVLGFTVLGEYFRKERNSYKLDLALGTDYTIELFSFPDPPQRPSRPEAVGLRHLAFVVDNIEEAVAHLAKHNIVCEPLRTDEYTNSRFTFFADPDGLPLEFYEVGE